ncbi:class II aldolase/adducin family protein [Noviherbaspirillum aerium]|uniref:class II aldolase/adducin family protein n=1 Tax=Noviherbaspirillum aerium TaxID=2588497 RepID=UPI00384FE964
MTDSNLIHRGGSPAAGATSLEEWEVRRDLAACYRLCALRHWDDLIYTHISAAVPGEPGRFLINPFGYRFDEITASNLVKIDLQGNIIGDHGYRINVTGFAIHAAVHAAREDAHCVMHLHNVNGIAVGAQEGGLLPLSQHALRFYGQIGYHGYEGLALSPGEQQRLVERLGQYPAMLLRNHGTLTCGRTIAEAFVLMDTLDKACEIQCKALSGATRLVMPDPETCARTHRELIGDGTPEGVLEWPALLRQLEQFSPTYKN